LTILSSHVSSVLYYLIQVVIFNKLAFSLSLVSNIRSLFSLKESKNLKDRAKIDELRDWICVILSKYCRRSQINQMSDDSSRFAKLLMRLPPVRSWSLKGVENLYFIKAANNFDNLLVEMFI
jgi:hypothetical protein